MDRQDAPRPEAVRLAELEAENADLLWFNRHLSQTITELEAGLVGGYGTDRPINPVHQLTADLTDDGQVRLTFTTRSGDGYRIAITPGEARAYAARLIRTASDAGDVQGDPGHQA